MTAAHDMIAMLRRHYLPEGRQPGWVFAPEIQAPTSGRRADLICQGVTGVSGRVLVGHEVKVTRADVLVELADPTKADAWGMYCNRWWLVVLDRTLIDGLDLPPSWGVMAPPSGRRTRTMTVVRPAPELHPVDQGPAYATIARWLHWRHHELESRHSTATAELLRLRAAVHHLSAQVPTGGGTRSALETVVADIVQQLGMAPHNDGRLGTWDAPISVADVVAALRDLGVVYRNAERVRWHAETVRRAVEHLAGVVNGDPLATPLADLAAAAAALQQKTPDAEGAA